MSDILQELQDRLDAGNIWTKARSVACCCKHHEYCDDCYPKEIRKGGKYFGMRFSFDSSDISSAIAEIERLRAEVERLKAAAVPVVGSGFALVVRSKEAKSADGSVMTRDDQEFLVTVNDGWVTGARYYGVIDGFVKVFQSADDATAFALSWGGHPWWVDPKRGKFRVIEIEEVAMPASRYRIKNSAAAPQPPTGEPKQ